MIFYRVFYLIFLSDFHRKFHIVFCIKHWRHLSITLSCSWFSVKHTHTSQGSQLFLFPGCYRYFLLLLSVCDSSTRICLGISKDRKYVHGIVVMHTLHRQPRLTATVLCLFTKVQEKRKISVGDSCSGRIQYIKTRIGL